MDPFAFQTGLFLWTLLTFGCLFLVLARFAFKPLQKILEKREKAIRDSLEQAQKAREAADKILAENEERLGQAREETRKIINEGHKIAADMKLEAREQAKEEANLIATRAQSEIDRELQKSLSELKTTVAGLSIRIARQVIKGSLDEKRHGELADEFIERLKKTRASRQS